MKAVVINSYGGPDLVELGEVDKLQLADNGRAGTQ